MSDILQIYRKQKDSFEEIGYYDDSNCIETSRFVDLENEIKYLYPTGIRPPGISTRIRAGPSSSVSSEKLHMPVLSSSLSSSSLSSTVAVTAAAAASSSTGHTGNTGDTSAPPKIVLPPHSSLLYNPATLPVCYSSATGGKLGVTEDSLLRTRKHTPCLPISRRALPGALSTREMEIYALSDSEDERVEMTKFHGGHTYGAQNYRHKIFSICFYQLIYLMSI